MFDEDTGPVATEELLVPGETCWRIERADRHAVFIDAGTRPLRTRSTADGAHRSRPCPLNPRGGPCSC